VRPRRDPGVVQVYQVLPGSRAWTSDTLQAPSLPGMPLEFSPHGPVQPATWKHRSGAVPAGGPCPETPPRQLAEFGFVEFERCDLQPVGSACLPSWSARTGFLLKSWAWSGLNPREPEFDPSSPLRTVDHALRLIEQPLPGCPAQRPATDPTSVPPRPRSRRTMPAGRAAARLSCAWSLPADSASAACGRAESLPVPACPGWPAKPGPSQTEL
jgi:hypothetical protein